MIDEDVDQRTSTPLPVGYEGSFDPSAGFEPAQSISDVLRVGSQSFVSYIERLERSVNESRLAASGTSDFEQPCARPLTGLSIFEKTRRSFTSWSPSDRYLRPLMESRSAVPVLHPLTSKLVVVSTFCRHKADN